MPLTPEQIAQLTPDQQAALGMYSGQNVSLPMSPVAAPAPTATPQAVPDYHPGMPLGSQSAAPAPNPYTPGFMKSSSAPIPGYHPGMPLDINNNADITPAGGNYNMPSPPSQDEVAKQIGATPVSEEKKPIGPPTASGADATSQPAPAPSAGVPAGPNRFQQNITATKQSAAEELESLRKQNELLTGGIQAAQQKASYSTEAINKQLADQMNVWEPYRQSKLDYANQLVTQRFDDLKKKTDAIPDVDVKKAFVGGTWGQLGAAIAQGLGAFGASLSKSRNFAADIINSAVEQNVNGQKANIEKQWKAVSQGTEFAKDEFARNMFMLQKEDDLRMAHYHLSEQMINNMATERYGQDPQAQANAQVMAEQIKQKQAEIQQRTADRVFTVQGQEETHNAALATATANQNSVSAKAYREYVDSVQKANIEHPDKPQSTLGYGEWTKGRMGEGAAAPTAVATANGKVSPRIATRIADANTAIQTLSTLGGRSINPDTRAAAQSAGGVVKSLAKELNLGDDNSLSWLDDPAQILQLGNQDRLRVLKQAIQVKQKELTDIAGKTGGASEGDGG